MSNNRKLLKVTGLFLGISLILSGCGGEQETRKPHAFPKLSEIDLKLAKESLSRIKVESLEFEEMLKASSYPGDECKSHQVWNILFVDKSGEVSVRLLLDAVDDANDKIANPGHLTIKSGGKYYDYYSTYDFPDNTFCGGNTWAYISGVELTGGELLSLTRLTNDPQALYRLYGSADHPGYRDVVLSDKNRLRNLDILRVAQALKSGQITFEELQQ
jgi:hypothetical protein